MNKPSLNQKISLIIDNLGNNGEGIGRYHGFTVFVDGALPGEEIEARVTECHSRYGRAQLISIIKPSTHRVQPPCKLFGRCGGCQLMHLAYPEQLRIKRQRIVDAFQRIGKIDNIEVAACLPSPSELAYRNKIQLPVRPGKDNIALGFFVRASHDLIEVEKCHIHCPLGEAVYSIAREVIKRSKILPYDPATGRGELRHLIIKSSVNMMEALVILVTTDQKSLALEGIAKEIIRQCPSVKGVLRNINRAHDNVILGDHYEILEGTDFIQERIGDLLFKVSPASFFQVNPRQAEHLYAKALEFAELKGSETVLDAYCGVGTLALYLAQKAHKVIGIECVPEAISDAHENARLNGINNATFICANAEAWIDSAVDIDVVVLNPPRKGCEQNFLDGIGRLRPKKVVYISCDPATLARDLSHLIRFGYRVVGAQPYDMFPQTAHVECVVVLNAER